MGVAGAAPEPKTAATGSVHCTITGKVAFKPSVKSTTAGVTVKFNGKLTSCTAADQGAIAGGTIKGTAVADPDPNCDALSDPLASSIQFTVKWKTKKPTPKLLDTTALAATGSSGLDDATGAIVADTTATPMPSGSFVADTLVLHLVLDATGSAIPTICTAKHATHSIKFTGVNGASTLDVTVPAVPPCQGSFTVDPAHGSDTNAGDCHAPFKTLTHALSVATGGDEVVAEPGVYGADSGETFPLAVPTGVQVTGDVTNFPGLAPSRGTAPNTEIDGDVNLGVGAALSNLLVVGTIDMRDATVLLSATVTTNGAAACVSLGAGSAVVMDSTMTNCDVGVEVVGQSDVQIAGSSITHNTTSGVIVSSPATADLGGGADGSTGGNQLSCSGAADLIDSGGVSAQNDFWDHVPPTFQQDGVPSGGVDVNTSGPNIPSSTGAQLVASPCA